MQLPCVVDMAANSFFAMASIGLSVYGQQRQHLFDEIVPSS